MMRRCIVALSFLAVTACASAPRATVPTLAYAVPAVNPASYVVADTTTVVVRGGRGRTLSTTIGMLARAAVGMHVDSVGMLASIRLESVDGTFLAGDSATSRVDSTSVPSGAALLRMSRRGADSTMSVPALDRALSRFISGESFYHQLFPRLPGGAVTPGMAWTDTLRLNDEGAGVQSRIESIVSSSLVADSVVDGRTLRVVVSRFTTRVEVSGIVDGLQVDQRLVGSGEATTLWDESASRMYSREETVTATGTSDLPGAGLRSAPVESRTRRVVRIQP
ncbi:MAG: hypothetical protein GX539_04715 [Candidatus Cloacimonetes bacterium]|nr:hypothetical protein [Candidatus Cloacimonadota bacterium]